MKLSIEGTEYPLEESLSKATLADLYNLKIKTGIGMKTLQRSLAAMEKLPEPEDFLDSEEILLALSALIWLCRRRAGEKLTLEEASNVELANVQFVNDEEAEVAAEVDPT